MPIMPDRINQKIQTIVFVHILVILFVMFLLLINTLAGLKAQTLRNYSTGRSNNTYLRTMVCIASESPTERTPDYVKQCYVNAEKANNVIIEHYGNGK